MDTLTLIIGSALVIFLAAYMLRLSRTIFMNLMHGRKFHQSLEQDFLKLRLSKMLGALGIDKTAYIYQTRVKDVHRHMNNCEACENIDRCDQKLASAELTIAEIDFCNNEAELKVIKQQMPT